MKRLFVLAGIVLLAACNLPSGTQVPAAITGPNNTPIQAATDTPVPPASAPTPDLAHYELLVVAPARFASLLQPLVDHKNRTGMPARLATLEAIYKTCAGKDEAEMVKRCLAAYQKTNGIRYALLVGGASLFPVRFNMADINTPAVFNTAYYGTDFYYADLYRADGSFDDWDANANGIYGEIGGEMRPGLLNIDNVDLAPDIAVGRLPAMNETEVETYVAKVILYETGAYHSEWAQRLLLISSSSFDAGNCKLQQEVAGMFPGMELVRLYPDGNPCLPTRPPDAADIIAELERGAGLVSYIGHGDTSLWADAVTIKDMMGVHNEKTLPIVFAGGCGTATFTVGAPGGPYIDIQGVKHPGAEYGEVFSAMPPPPAPIQPENVVDGMMKYMLVQTPSGAVAYIGAITGAQFPALFDLNSAFFQAIAKGDPAVGDAWNSAIRQYYRVNQFDESYTNADWYVLARFHQPWKFLLFGDPSLRIGGVAAQ